MSSTNPTKYILVAVAFLLSSVCSFAQTKTVWVSATVFIDISLKDDSSGRNFNFQVKNSDGSVLSDVTLSESEAKNNNLATFFKSIDSAIKELASTPFNQSPEKAAVTVTVTPTGTTVASLGGKVTVTGPDGKIQQVDVGTGVVFNADGTQSTKTLAQIVAEEKAAGTAGNSDSFTSALSGAVKDLSDRVAENKAGSDSLGQLAALIKVASAANPSGAAEYVGVAVKAATSSTSGIKNKYNAIAAIAEAASGSLTGADLIAMQEAAAKAGQANGVKDADIAAKTTTKTSTNGDVVSTFVVPNDTNVMSPDRP